MDPATIALIVGFIQAAIKAAPQVAQLAVEAKNFVTSLFKAGLIGKVQQDALHAHVDDYCAALLAGKVPPEFTVEPDPTV